MRRKMWCDGWKRKYFRLGWGIKHGPSKHYLIYCGTANDISQTSIQQSTTWPPLPLPTVKESLRYPVFFLTLSAMHTRHIYRTMLLKWHKMQERIQYPNQYEDLRSSWRSSQSNGGWHSQQRESVLLFLRSSIWIWPECSSSGWRGALGSYRLEECPSRPIVIR
jgi:hypothetical protein